MEPEEAFCNELADRLDACRSALIQQVLAEVRGNPEVPTAQRLGAPQLRDHLPAVLDRLATSLRGAARVRARLPAGTAADEHGHTRWAQHYRLDELVRELGVVESVVMREGLDALVAEGRAPCPEAIIAAREGVRWFFEDAVAASAERFVQQAGHARDEAEQRLRQLDASRMALLRTVTHELRGILQTLTLAIEAVAAEADEGDRARMQEVCRRNLADMGALLQELTDYQILLAGQVRPEVETVSVADFAATIVDAFGPLARASGVELQVDAEIGLERVRSDPRRLRQIVTNLVVNALKYRRRNATDSWVRVTFETAAEGHWRIVIDDNGVGIAAEDLERIFDEFQQVAASREGVSGIGLGLTITRRLARLLGGEIRVTSTPGAGSRFEVTLPREFPEPPSPEEPAPLLER
ncbi:MAG: HAMP domain-containing histidine kinase [Verrucomicrobia bacterium]|nr:HAMP domain-containing histidine kinase [Verrucomicrobiota bacterium]